MSADPYRSIVVRVTGPTPWWRKVFAWVTSGDPEVAFGTLVVFMVSLCAFVAWINLRPDPRLDCDRDVVAMAIHHAEAGELLAVKLEATNFEAAQAVRELTSIRSQPDRVRLCVLLSERAP